MKSHSSPIFLITILGAALSGCAIPQAEQAPPPQVNVPVVEAPVPAPPPPAPAPPVRTALAADLQALKEGISLYNNGDYSDAIKRLNAAPEIWVSGPKSSQLEAMKYIAFCYCLTGRNTLCRLQFEKALKLDPSFHLAPGENGHPLWGPVFARAKKAK